MAADRREKDATPGAAGGGAGPEELIRTTGDPASGALVVLRSEPRGGGSEPPSSGAGAAPDLAGLEDEALDRFEIRVCRLRAAREGADDGVVVTAVVRAPHRRAAFAAARWALAAARERVDGPEFGDAGDP